jgi:hypothetical protein
VYQILLSATWAQAFPLFVVNAETSTNVVLLALPSDKTEQ